MHEFLNVLDRRQLWGFRRNAMSNTRRSVAWMDDVNELRFTIEQELDNFGA